jgi:hypothetical protein
MHVASAAVARTSRSSTPLHGRGSQIFSVLIIGGYGTFGGRLVDLLADEPRLRLIVGGRSLERASAFCRRPSQARLEPVAFDRDSNVPDQLRKVGVDLVVDASGPFQVYGDDPYRVARAALQSGANYLDLADSAAFVQGIGSLDPLAKEQDCVALAGVSSFPVLTAAVVRVLADGLAFVDSIEGGIAPSPFAGVGLNVVRAIASYAGRPVTVTDGGRHTTRYGFIDSRRYIVNVPGCMPLPAIRFGLVEVPDLAVLAEDWPEAKSIWMGAGPTPALLHRLLWCAAWLVRLRLLPSLSRFAPLMNRVINTARWGEHRGGMYVEVRGRGQRGPETRSWHLLAEGDVGLLIPSMAAEALIRKWLDGQAPQPGARPAHRDLELVDYDRLFERRGIRTGFRRDAGGAPALYEQLMGSAFMRLAEPVQQVHRWEREAAFEGRAMVVRGSGTMANIIAGLFRFPRAMPEGPVSVTMSRDDRGRELWRRNFAGQSFTSVQEAGAGRSAGLLVERFGVLAFAMAVVENNGQLELVLRRWSMLGIPLPLCIAPRATAIEHAADGRFNFSVDIALPMLSRLVRYEGWLAPAIAPVSG